MKENSSFEKHHAFLLISSGEDIAENFLKKKLNFDSFNNLDFWSKDIETFGIEDSRELKKAHLRKSFQKDEKKVFVVHTSYITPEAQNALLKILEDPQPNSFFVFVMSSRDSLIPTLMSRFFVLEDTFESKDKTKSDLGFDVSLFVDLSPGGRIKKISKIVSSKDKDLALSFLNELEKFLKEKIDLKTLGREKLDSFEIIMESRNNLKITGASIKMILENLCLTLPRE